MYGRGPLRFWLLHASLIAYLDSRSLLMMNEARRLHLSKSFLGFAFSTYPILGSRSAAEATVYRKTILVLITPQWLSLG